MILEKVKITAADVEKIIVTEAAKELVLSFAQKGKTISSAESCTGGAFGSAITAISGASAVYLGGVISYTNDVKMNMLGVNSSTLDAYTAVSEFTAVEMSRGVRERLGSDFSISVTGYAGPTGGDDINPVGTVFVSVSHKGSDKVTRLSFEKGIGREEIRKYAVYFMIKSLCVALNEA